MIASLFNKSRPLNYAIISLLLVLFYFLYLTQYPEWTEYYTTVVQKIGLLLVLTGSLFLVRFVTKRNGLSKDNSYAPFLFLLFHILFPSVLVNTNIILANFFILLSLRRLISLQSLITPKEKIFDASLWIFVATLFHFWSIVFIVLVFVSIVFHVSRDYRNWIIPFIALFTVGILFTLAVVAGDRDLLFIVLDKAYISFDFTYFENIYQNIALAIFSSIAVLFFVTQLLALSSRPLNMQSSYKKVLFSFVLGVGIYVLSASKNNSFLAFTFFPLAVMGTNFIESLDNKWVRESVMYSLIVISFFIFFAQVL